MRESIDLTEVVNIDAQLSEEEGALRLKLIDLMLKGLPVPLSKLSPREIVILESIAKKGFVVLNEDGVEFLYPVSGKPTTHRVTLEDGRSFNAMCAIDSLGSAFLFNQNIRISSKCAQSGDGVEIEIKSGKIVRHKPEDIHVIHVDLNELDNWATSC